MISCHLSDWNLVTHSFSFSWYSSTCSDVSFLYCHSSAFFLLLHLFISSGVPFSGKLSCVGTVGILHGLPLLCFMDVSPKSCIELSKLDAALTEQGSDVLSVGISKFRLFGVCLLEEHCDEGVMLSGFTGEGVAIDGRGLAIAGVGIDSEGSTDGVVRTTATGVATAAGMTGAATGELVFFFSASILSFCVDLEKCDKYFESKLIKVTILHFIVICKIFNVLHILCSFYLRLK